MNCSLRQGQELLRSLLVLVWRNKVFLWLFPLYTNTHKPSSTSHSLPTVSPEPSGEHPQSLFPHHWSLCPHPNRSDQVSEIWTWSVDRGCEQRARLGEGAQSRCVRDEEDPQGRREVGRARRNFQKEPSCFSTFPEPTGHLMCEDESQAAA